MLLNVDQENMKQKNYDLKVLALANLLGYVDEQKKGRVIDRLDLLCNMRESLDMSRYRCGIVLNALIEMGFIQEEKDNYILGPVSVPFISLDESTSEFLLRALDPLSFKVYCLLRNKSEVHERYNLKEKYLFSKKSLLESCGYSRSQKGLEKIDEVLKALETFHLIEYGYKRSKNGGNYYELLSVEDYV